MYSKPKTLFLFDGIGALLSALILGSVFPMFIHVIGLPVDILYFLAFFPVVFLIYDICCYVSVKKKFRKWLTGIAILNLLYCGISIWSICSHYEHLTPLGFVYFLLEITIIVVLVIVELKVASRKNI
ncbi:hypothetical protein [Aquimarina sp. AU474]|uniref:hypothetical protein n=1 Tax=Aquimarina sp. AU474 TaxID=2108529 RepID=UPI000D68843E|nr:hypothetical protein [Aquimarina sp. AU474]